MTRPSKFTERLEFWVREDAFVRLKKVVKPNECRSDVLREALDEIVANRERAAVAAAFWGERG